MKISKITGFEVKKVFQSGKWSQSLIPLLAYLGMAYTMAPAGVMDSLAISSFVLFLAMIVLGLNMDAIETDMINAAVIVKTGFHCEHFYLAKIVTAAVYCILGTCIAVGAALLRFVVSGTDFFLRSFTWQDVVSALILHFLMGMIGAMAGLLLNKRIIENRAMAIALGVLFAILCLIKGALNTDFPWMIGITWVLPPISDLIKNYGEAEFFHSGLLLYFVWQTAYLFILCAAYIIIMKRKKYQ